MINMLLIHGLIHLHFGLVVLNLKLIMLIKTMDNFTWIIMTIINNLELLIGQKFKEVMELHFNKLESIIFLTNLKFSLQPSDLMELELSMFQLELLIKDYFKDVMLHTDLPLSQLNPQVEKLFMLNKKDGKVFLLLK